MKLLNALIFTIGVVSAQEEAAATSAPYGDMLGQLYVGACSATQSDMYNTGTNCYAAAEDVSAEFSAMFNVFDPAAVTDRA